MTGHVKRFIDSPQKQTEASFVRLFGSTNFKSRIVGIAKQDREDAVVTEYCKSVRLTGQFKYVSPAIVLHPDKDRTHFHLIYATRHPRGTEVFKEAEKKAMPEMEQVRAEAQKRRREQVSGMGELFPAEVLHDPTYYESLRTRYLAMTQKTILRRLRAKHTLHYDTAWVIALAHPLIWENDLKDWIRTWVSEGSLKVEGLTGRQRVPQRGKGNILVWLAN